MPRISQKKLDALKGRGRAIGRGIKATVKTSGVEALTGVVSFYGVKAIADRSEFMRSKWYMVPAAMAVAGHFIKRKRKLAQFGASLLGAAGYAGAMNYEMNKAAQPKDTGALMGGRRDAGALQGYDGLPDTIDTDASPGTSDWFPNESAGDASAAMAL